MRIIAGEFGGRRIEAPPGTGTRPMLDRVREALFSTLGGRLDGARVLDLFSGSGALGLEAVSRGAAHARLVELDGRVAVLGERNVDQLGVADRVRTVRGDALDPATWAERAGARRRAPGDAREGPIEQRFDVIFFDPPYPMVRDGPARKRVLQALERLVADQLAPDGTLVFHAPRQLLQAAELAAFEARERTYGTSSLWYLSRREPAAGGPSGEFASPEPPRAEAP